MTVESTAARKPRRSAAGKTGTTGSKAAGTTGTRRATAKKPTDAQPELVQLLTPEGKRVKNAEYDPFVADITADELRACTATWC